MNDLGPALVLGLVHGLEYALLAVGIVLVFRANRFVNFAHAQLGAVAAALLACLAGDWGWPYWVSLPIALGGAAGVAALIERTLVQRLFNASRLVLMVATLGVAQILFGATLVGPLATSGLNFPVPFTFQLEVFGVPLNSSQVATLIVGPAAALALYLFLSRTAAGRLIRAGSSNPEAARLAGISVRRISLFVWFVAGLGSGLTAILQAPSNPSLNLAGLGPSLLLRGLAAALIGQMTQPLVTFGAAIAIGVLEQVAVGISPRGGTADLAVLVIILVAIAIRARGLASTSRRGDDQLEPERSRPPLSARLQHVHLARQLGRYAWGGLALFGLLLPALPGMQTQAKAVLLALLVVYAIVGVSMTVLTGWAGQVSLGHFAFVGVGAYAFARLDASGWAAPATLVGAGLAAAAVAVVVGLPALRFRGLFLAVATLAFALAAQSSLFRFEFVSGNSAGNASVGDPRIVGLGSIQSPRALYYVALAVLAVVVLALRSLRSTGAGRALIAVRDNERVAAAHGLSPMAVKVLALGMSGFVAGVAGGLWAGIQHSWSAQLIDPSFGITMLGLAIVGGVGRLHGPILGALAVFALPYLPDGWNTAPVRALSSGVLLLVILLFLPGGLASLLDRARLAALRWIERGLPEQPFAPVDGADPIVVTDLSVSFGGLKAVDEASLRVGAGEIVGLMGGNGAGKTTLLNAISGHQGTERGRVVLYGRDVTGLAPEFRPALAAARTFQDAQLYPGLTVLETVQVALDRTNRTGTLGGLVSAPWARAGERRKRERAVEVLGRFGLGDRLDTKVSELSTGMRRLLDIACVVASGPKLVLLDEPMAGVAQREVEAFAPMLRALRDELGCSVLIIEHDVPLLTSLCDRIYAMEAGAIIADGSPHQVCSDPRVVAGYLGTDTVSVRRSGGRRPKPARPARRTTTGRRSTTTKKKEGSTAR